MTLKNLEIIYGTRKQVQKENKKLSKNEWGPESDDYWWLMEQYNFMADGLKDAIQTIKKLRGINGTKRT